MAQSALQRAKAAARAKGKGKKSKPRTSYRDCIVKRNVIIPDINHGAWSFIDQPPSSDSGIPDFLT